MEIDQTTPTSATEDFDILRVGLCQVYTEPWAVEDNLNRTIAAIEEAAAQGAEVAVTPEAVVLGYPDHDSEQARLRFRALAEPVDGARMTAFRSRADGLSIYLVVGFVELGADGRIHNSAALISPQGELLYTYRKIHCRTFEDSRHTGAFTPGDRFYVAELQLGTHNVKAGTMICFDREITEATRCLRALGAEIVFCPLATDTGELSSQPVCVDNELVTRVRAAENEVFIVVVNHAGRYNGGSFVVGPEGEVLRQLGPEAGVAVIDVPIGAVPMKFHRQPRGEMGWGYRAPQVYVDYLGESLG